MTERQREPFDQRVRTIAGTFEYPPTPDIAGAIAERLHSRQAGRRNRRQARWAFAAALVLVLLMGVLAVPQVRAGVLEIIRIGVVRIFPQGFEGVPVSTQTPETESHVSTPAATALPATASPPRLSSVLELAGETTLAEARQTVDVPIRLPAYPPDLGPPDRVFVQQMEGTAVVLVWLEPGSREDVRMSLHILTSGVFAGKSSPTIVQETTVHGQRALWTEGPYLLRVQNGNYDLIRLVAGHVLIWEEDAITYRLETGVSLDEALRSAESLRE